MRKSGETDRQGVRGPLPGAPTCQTSQPQILKSFLRQRSSPRSSDTNKTLIACERMAMPVLAEKAAVGKRLRKVEQQKPI